MSSLSENARLIAFNRSKHQEGAAQKPGHHNYRVPNQKVGVIISKSGTEEVSKFRSINSRLESDAEIRIANTPLTLRIKNFQRLIVPFLLYGVEI